MNDFESLASLQRAIMLAFYRGDRYEPPVHRTAIGALQEHDYTPNPKRWHQFFVLGTVADFTTWPFPTWSCRTRPYDQERDQ